MELINSIPEVLAILIALAGLIISVVGLPGVWLVSIGAFVWSWVNGFTLITWPWLITFLIISILSMFVDNVAVILGAKKYGSSNWGIVGCIVGLLIGTLVGGFMGTIIGAFLGAVAMEMLFAKKDSNSAFRAGIGTMLGFFVGLFLKFILALLVIIIWWNLAL